MGLIGQIIGKKTRVQFVQNSTATVIQLDCSLKENHTRKSPATKFPVENGNNISDHIIVEPFELEITGVITDTPIGGLSAALSEISTTLISTLVPPVGVVAAGAAFSLYSALAKSKSPSVAAYAQLLNLQANAQPFDVITSLYRYPSMWIQNLTAPRDDGTGEVLIFTVNLAQLILVSPQSVSVQIFANPGLAAGKGNLGQQGPELPNGFAAGQAKFHTLVGGSANP